MATSKKSTGETLFDLTSYVVDTPANHSQQQENEMALMTHDTFGLGYAKPLANYDLDTQSWRMYEATLLSDSPPFSGSWPASGMTLNGKLFRKLCWCATSQRKSHHCRLPRQGIGQHRQCRMCTPATSNLHSRKMARCTRLHCLKQSRCGLPQQLQTG